jgi:hypothetical protein
MSNKSAGFSIKPAHEYLKQPIEQEPVYQTKYGSTYGTSTTAQKPSTNTISNVTSGSARGMAIRTSSKSQADYY